MAKKQISTYKFFPGVIPPAYNQYPNAVAVIDANKTFLIKEISAFIALGASTPSIAPEAYPNAILLLTNNKEFIKEEANAWIETQIAAATVGQTFYQYNYTPTIATKCRRDIGYQVDAWIDDITGGGNAETIRISRQYQLNGEAQLLNPDEEAAVYTFIKTLVTTKILPISLATTFQDPVVVAQNVSGSTGEAPAIVRASTLIDIAVSFIATPVTANAITIVPNYNATFVGYTYNNAKCERDAEYVLDSFLYDLSYGGNSLTNYVASRYYINGVIQINQPAVEVAAYEFLKDLINSHILINYYSARYQLVYQQQITASNGEAGSVTAVSTLVDTVIDSISVGLSSVPAIVLPDSQNGELLPTTVALLEANKRFIQEEAIAFIQYNIDNNIPPFVYYTYNAAKCRRDISYVLEGYISDLMHGGNRQTVFNAKAYYENGVSQLDGDRQPEIYVHTFIRDLIDNFILDNVPFSARQSVIFQVLLPGLLLESYAPTRIKELSNTILDVIEYGLSYLPAVASNRGYVKIQGFYKIKDLLLITNASRNVIMYNFADPTTAAEITYSESADSDFPAFIYGTDKITTITFDVVTSNMMVTDNIQIFVEAKEQEVRLNRSASDAMERMKVGIPQSMLDADFEYGLQPTKWQAIGLMRNYPAIYEIPGSDIPVVTVVTDASVATSGVGASKLTVTTLSSHGLLAGSPITIKALANSVLGFSRAEGSFQVFQVLSATEFTYYAKSKVGSSDGTVLSSTYTQLRKGGYYTGSEVGSPSFNVFSSGSSGTITTNLITAAGRSVIGFIGTVPPIGAPIQFSNPAFQGILTSGTQITAVTGPGGVAASTALTLPAAIGDTTLSVNSTAGISAGLIFNRGDGFAVTVTDVTGNVVTLGSPLTSALIGTTDSYTSVTGTTVDHLGNVAVFNISRNGSVYTATITNPGTTYSLSDTILIDGTALGGTTLTNDATLTVTSASSQNTVATLNNASLVGGSDYFNAINVATSGGSGTGLTLNITTDGAGLITAATINQAGAGYLAGETVKIGSWGRVIGISSLDNAGTGYSSNTNVATSGGGGTGLTVNINAELNGSIISGTLTAAGTGYIAGSNVTVTGGSGNGFTANITANNLGGVVTNTLTTAGTGYVTASNAGTTGGTGTGLTFNVVATNGAALTSTLTTGGAGYLSGSSVGTTGGFGSGLRFATTVATSPTPGAITSVTIETAGLNYQAGDIVSIDGGDGNATVTINTVNNGAISSITINSQGSGYQVNNVVTILTGNANATATINSIGNGAITGFTINASGLGYVAGDVLTLTGGNANATITVNSATTGAINSVSISAPGTGYAATDIITIAGGSGTATFTVTSVTQTGLIDIGTIAVGGLIQTVSVTGTPITATSVDFLSAITISEVTNQQIGNGNTGIAYSAIGTIQVTFNTAHGFVPGNTITVAISSSGAGAQLAGGPFFVEQVPTSTTLRYTARAAGTIANTLVGIVYARPDSFFVHRPFDGGVQLGTASSSHGAVAIRMSKKYIRYQSGKGVTYNTGALFAPSYDIRSITASGTTAGSQIFVVTDDTDHGCQIGAVITISGVQTAGYNGTYTVSDITDERAFTVLATQTLGTTSAVLDSPCQMSIKNWHGSTIRSGIFDDQNGMFWQYDGRRMAVVRRSSTFQVAGTISIAANNNVINGTNSRFTQQLTQGDRVVIRGMTHVITQVISDSSMTVAPDFRGVNSVSNVKICKTVDLVVPQEDFNLDPCNGSGPSGYNLDPTKMQMIGIQHTWYGAGFIDFMLRGPNGDYIYVHRFRNSNVNTEAYMRTGNQPVRYEVINEDAKGRTTDSMTASQTTIPLSIDDAYWFPNSGTVLIDNELIRYTGNSGTALTGCTRAATLTQFTAGSQRGFSGAAASTHDAGRGVVLVSNTISPNISHWGSAFMIDGQFDSDRGYIFNYAATGISASVDKITSFLIRLAPSVSNAQIGDLGEKELLNRAQLLLNAISITSDSIDSTDPFRGNTWSASGTATNGLYYSNITAGVKNWYQATSTGTFSATAPTFTSGTGASATFGVNLTWAGATPNNSGAIVVEGVLNPSNYPSDPTNITWTGLANAAAGGQPSFAQIAAGGSVTWSGNVSTTTATVQGAFTTTVLAKGFTAVTTPLTAVSFSTVQQTVTAASFSFGTSATYNRAFDTNRSDFLITTSSYDALTTPLASGDPISASFYVVTRSINFITRNFISLGGISYTRIVMNGNAQNSSPQTFGADGSQNILTTISNAVSSRYLNAISTARTDFLVTQAQLDASSESVTDVLSAATVLTSGQTISVIQSNFTVIAGVQYARIFMSSVGSATSSTGSGNNVSITATSAATALYGSALSTGRTDFLITNTQFDSSGILAGDGVSAASSLTGGQTINSITRAFITIGGVSYTRIVLSSSANSSGTIGVDITVTVTASGTAASYTSRNFLFFTSATWLASGAVLGTKVSSDQTQFPAGTSVAGITTRTLGATTVYRVIFTQTSNATFAAAGTLKFAFGAQYALPGEQVFSFIANPGNTEVLDLSELKELTATALGGRGTFPNGPDVLAINVYKVAGGAVPTNVILRWGEAQA
jgi:hypothetical protein